LKKFAFQNRKIFSTFFIFNRAPFFILRGKENFSFLKVQFLFSKELDGGSGLELYFFAGRKGGSGRKFRPAFWPFFFSSFGFSFLFHKIAAIRFIVALDPPTHSRAKTRSSLFVC
jgi:hypothetical protein